MSKIKFLLILLPLIVPSLGFASDEKNIGNYSSSSGAEMTQKTLSTYRSGNITSHNTSVYKAKNTNGAITAKTKDGKQYVVSPVAQNNKTTQAHLFSGKSTSISNASASVSGEVTLTFKFTGKVFECLANISKTSKQQNMTAAQQPANGVTISHSHLSETTNSGNDCETIIKAMGSLVCKFDPSACNNSSGS